MGTFIVATTILAHQKGLSLSKILCDQVRPKESVVLSVRFSITLSHWTRFIFSCATVQS